MKKSPVVFLAAMLAASLAASAARADLILSELCDPQSNYLTDRFIEIYNSGPAVVNLSGWSVIAIANGVDVETWPLTGTIAVGQALVCGAPNPATAFTVNFQKATWSQPVNPTNFNWNGQINDGAKLVYFDGVTTTIIDKVQATGTLFKDAEMSRISTVSTPTPTYNPAEWTITPRLLATDANPGTHNGSTPPPPSGPVISSIVTDPAAPAAGVPVDVQASVVDSLNPITAVTVSWGLSSVSLTNVIGMVPTTGSTYRTSAQIPGQPGGASVYYQIKAETDSASTTSTVKSYTIPGGGGGIPPTVLAVGEMSDSTFLVFYSETVSGVSSQNPANYTIGTKPAVAAVQDIANPSQVLITVRGVAAGTQTLTVNGVADSTGDTAYGATRSFNYVDVTIPAGYYDSVAGLRGSALRIALHNIIKNHTVISYSQVLTAFETTDVKPNGKVWDPYSDVPGGIPPYEYSFGQTGQGATEGLGYNREHSFPQSWFNGSGPLYSDVWNLYPTDAKVNGYRANYPYGAVGTPTITSLNGSKLGNSVTAGYSGTVFEPIDGYKGDLMRSQFYIATRYYGENSGWPGSPSWSNGDFTPWAVAQYMAWCNADPVSWKERMRNGAIYVIQHNRNPFVDHPEYVSFIYDSLNTVGVPAERPVTTLQLHQSWPNPFRARTAISFDLDRTLPVTVRVLDVAGRSVRTLVGGASLAPGAHRLEWDGRSDAGQPLSPGLYVCQFEAGGRKATQRMVLVR